MSPLSSALDGTRALPQARKAANRDGNSNLPVRGEGVGSDCVFVLEGEAVPVVFYNSLGWDTQRTVFVRVALQGIRGALRRGSICCVLVTYSRCL
jgi:hypothetical protein